MPQHLRGTGLQTAPGVPRAQATRGGGGGAKWTPGAVAAAPANGGSRGKTLVTVFPKGGGMRTWRPVQHNMGGPHGVVTASVGS